MSKVAETIAKPFAKFFGPRAPQQKLPAGHEYKETVGDSFYERGGQEGDNPERLTPDEFKRLKDTQVSADSDPTQLLLLQLYNRLLLPQLLRHVELQHPLRPRPRLLRHRCLPHRWAPRLQQLFLLLVDRNHRSQRNRVRLPGLRCRQSRPAPLSRGQPLQIRRGHKAGLGGAGVAGS